MGRKVVFAVPPKLADCRPAPSVRTAMIRRRYLSPVTVGTPSDLLNVQPAAQGLRSASTSCRLAPAAGSLISVGCLLLPVIAVCHFLLCLSICFFINEVKNDSANPPVGHRGIIATSGDKFHENGPGVRAPDEPQEGKKSI